ncbi:MAG: SdiA-regulated domain-containing protein [Melioribacteraceae bacterium]|nr:SdiA-regulated domain-containing protein [Melioribacteraceae bacterium]
MSKELNEISGITFSDVGDLFCHTDEVGIIYQLEINTGKIIKKFYIGESLLKADFEDITFANGFFYLVSSSGAILKFKEGKDNEKVQYERFVTPLSSKNDIEGIAYVHQSNSLLLACKESPGKKLKGVKAVYRFSLDDNKLINDPFILIKENELNGFFSSSFKSSAIISMNNGNLLILGGKSIGLVEISQKGQVINKIILNNYHLQPEGIAISKKGILIISDEAAGKNPYLTIYKKTK